jgi:ELWxxDGT repeat protein
MPDMLTAAGATLYLVAGDAAHGRALWRTDGTGAGTQLVADVAAGGDSDPSDLLNGRAASGSLRTTAEGEPSGGPTGRGRGRSR